MENLQLVNEAGKEMDQYEISEEMLLRMDGGPGVKGHSIQEDGPCNASVDLELGIPQTETSAASSPVAPSVLAPVPLQQCPFSAEMDCLICFNRYSLARLPKVLACQHAFCAVCLKLILRNEDHAWIIGCPLCRKTTAVFGGLICSLRNQEHIMAHLGSPDPEAEVAEPPFAAGACRSQHPSSEMQSQGGGDATKRLNLLLLLLSLLIVLMLPFMNTGLLTWSLCFMIVLGAIVSAVLCWEPSWTCPSLSLPLCVKKVNQVA